MRRRGAALVVTAALFATGCGGAPSPPPAPAATAAAAKPAPAPAAAPMLPKDPERTPLPPIAYEPRQRRDPFKPPPPPVVDTAKRGPAFDTFKLVGVISGANGPLALVEGPDGLGYILKTGDVLGKGRVTQITEDSVQFAVAASGGGATSVTLRLQTN
jgi:type IV pilus assembly protein PilP